MKVLAVAKNADTSGMKSLCGRSFPAFDLACGAVGGYFLFLNKTSRKASQRRPRLFPGLSQTDRGEGMSYFTRNETGSCRLFPVFFLGAP